MADEEIMHQGIRIIGLSNMPGKVARDANGKFLLATW
ncbi:MAG: hypothetical protein R2865_08010 [Deinococcales bacterium]